MKMGSLLESMAWRLVSRMVETKHMKGALWYISARMLALKMFYLFGVPDHMCCIMIANQVNLLKK
uniref:Uncharacterized protein n=1 Tax=Arundo donax TaxID=35708 RepID=A0A0A9CTL8_ARUDO